MPNASPTSLLRDQLWLRDFFHAFYEFITSQGPARMCLLKVAYRPWASFTTCDGPSAVRGELPISRGGATAGWMIVLLPNTSRESMSGGTRIVLEGRDAYGKMIVAETPLGNGQGSKIFNPYAAEDRNSQP
jgi:hypothetical protein